MREFFHGWKRKVGCLTLALACIFLAGWIRSQLVSDRLHFRIGNVRFLVRSFPGILYFHTVAGGPPRLELRLYSYETESPRFLSASTEIEAFPPSGRVWVVPLMWYGFWGDEPHSWLSGMAMRDIHLIYWPLSFPLALLSAWLLLSKLRAGKIDRSGFPARTEP